MTEPLNVVVIRPTDPERGDPLTCTAGGCPRDAITTAVIDPGPPDALWAMTSCDRHEAAMRYVAQGPDTGRPAA